MIFNRYELTSHDESSSIYVVICPVSQFRLHCHNRIEFLMVLQGEIELGVGSEQYHLQAGQFVILNPLVIFSTVQRSEQATLLRIRISDEIAAEVLDKNFKLPELLLRQKKNPSAYASYCDALLSIAQEYNKRGTGYKARAERTAQSLISSFCLSEEYEQLKKRRRQRRKAASSIDPFLYR